MFHRVVGKGTMNGPGGRSLFPTLRNNEDWDSSQAGRTEGGVGEGAEPSASLLSSRLEAPMQQHPLSTGGFRFSSLHRDSCLLLAPECSNLAGKDKY